MYSVLRTRSIFGGSGPLKIWRLLLRGNFKRAWAVNFSEGQSHSRRKWSGVGSIKRLRLRLRNTGCTELQCVVNITSNVTVWQSKWSEFSSIHYKCYKNTIVWIQVSLFCPIPDPIGSCFTYIILYMHYHCNFVGHALRHLHGYHGLQREFLPQCAARPGGQPCLPPADNKACREENGLPCLCGPDATLGRWG